MNNVKKIGAAATAFTIAFLAVPSYPAFADSIRDKQWYLSTLRISESHAISTGSGVTVAVVDSGVAPHPDLRRNLLPGRDATTTNGSGNGQTDSVGHGTQMASLIAGHGQGTSGVQGIAPGAKILPIRVSNSVESASYDDLDKGLLIAVDSEAKIINASLGGAPGLTLNEATQKAAEKDIVIVASIGNSSNGIAISYPAGFDSVLAVGTVGKNNQYSTVSLKSPKVDICAPGVDIVAANPGGKYATGNGSSQATAIVSGAAALVRSKFPQLSAQEVIHRLTATADDIGPPGKDDECGYGRLNIVNALTADVLPATDSTATPTASATPSETATAVEPTTEPTATSAAESPSTEPASNNTPLIYGAVIVLLLIGGGVTAVMLARRNRP